MTLESRIVALAEAIGADIKNLTVKQGDLTSLATTAKTSLVAAINEVAASGGGSGGAGIDDAATSTTTTWSSSKISAQISAAVSALVANAPTALDTLNELAAALDNDPSYAATVATALGNRLRFDAAQALSAEQRLQACTNLGIGNYDRNFVADYTAAKS